MNRMARGEKERKQSCGCGQENLFLPTSAEKSKNHDASDGDKNAEMDCSWQDLKWKLFAAVVSRYQRIMRNLKPSSETQQRRYFLTSGTEYFFSVISLWATLPKVWKSRWCIALPLRWGRFSLHHWNFLKRIVCFSYNRTKILAWQPSSKMCILKLSMMCQNNNCIEVLL